MTFKPGSRVSRRGGFTLVELLVVIGIILLLLGMLLPAISLVRRKMDRAATQADFATISTALEAYRSDFNDYPRPSMITNYPRAERILAWALIGPYNAPTKPGVSSPPASYTASGVGPASLNLAGSVYGPWPTNQTAPFNYPLLVDGADGPGFRTSGTWYLDPATSTYKFSGSRVWGPYLQPDKWQFQTQDGLAWTKWNKFKYDLQDRWGMPIEYFPRWNQPGGKAKDSSGRIHLFGLDSTWVIGTSISNDIRSIYDFEQQWTEDSFVLPAVPITATQSIKYLCKALGDDTWDTSSAPNGYGWRINDMIEPALGERLRDTPEYILMSRGPKKRFSDDDTIWKNFSKCSEITNLPPR